jgi:hypothetical protein
MFQRRGKEHIRYIHSMAEKEWCHNNFKIPFTTCLKYAMERHIEYILQLEEKMERFNNPNPPMAPRIKDFARPTSALNE